MSGKRLCLSYVMHKAPGVNRGPELATARVTELSGADRATGYFNRVSLNYVPRPMKAHSDLIHACLQAYG